MRDILKPNSYYHIFNHANGSENLFRETKNYYFFLEKYFLYISPIAVTFAYCLMPNHFHFLIKIKNEEKILEYAKGSGKFKASDSFLKIISSAFKKFFTSYTNSYNKIYERKGNLFQQKFKRIEITDVFYLKHAINYIHKNPVSHEFCKNPEDWEFSSFNYFFGDNNKIIDKDQVIKWFEELNSFAKFHNDTSFEKYGIEMELLY